MKLQFGKIRFCKTCKGYRVFVNGVCRVCGSS